MQTRRTFAGLVSAAALSPKSVAAAPSDASRLLQEQGRYLPWITEQRAKWSGEVLGQGLATVGDERGAFAEARDNSKWPSLNLDEIRARPAIDAICDAAKGRRLVILNEAHHVSRCRAFATALALRLRTEGFSILAAETFQQTPVDDFDSKVNGGSPITTQIGYYTHDPVFAEFVRSARNAGFRLYPYEADENVIMRLPPDQLAREQGESLNVSALLRKHPDARLLVYCGYGHDAKIKKTDGLSMAAQVKAITGVDPLTINQSICLPSPNGADDPPELTRLLDRFADSEPLALFGGDGEAFRVSENSVKGAYDFTILHPRVPYRDGRPGWLAGEPGRRRCAVAVPAGLAAGSLAQAVPTTELALAKNTVPSDQYPLPYGAVWATFYLRPGQYDLRVETPDGFRPISRVQV